MSSIKKRKKTVRCLSEKYRGWYIRIFKFSILELKFTIQASVHAWNALPIHGIHYIVSSSSKYPLSARTVSCFSSRSRKRSRTINISVVLHKYSPFARTFLSFFKHRATLYHNAGQVSLWKYTDRLKRLGSNILLSVPSTKTYVSLYASPLPYGPPTL